MNLREKLKERSKRCVAEMDKLKSKMNNPNLTILELSDLRSEYSREIGYLACINDLMLETI